MTSREGRATPGPEETAERCGLAYVDPESPGIRRRRRGAGFSYHDPEGELIRDEEVRRRVEKLAIPPAWREVWICPDPDGHLQVTGRDAAGRRQYLYHERFRAARERVKFARLVPFGRELPALRRRVGRDLAREGLSRSKVAAAGVRILDLAAIRVGNPEYARTNGTYGLVTLRRRHVELGRKRAGLRFDGKGGREVTVELVDADLVKVLRDCDELPGYRLLQYVTDDGEKTELGVDELNAYIAGSGDGDFSAKDFRTWAGTTTAITELTARERGDDEGERRSVLVDVAGVVADRLHNTAAVARASYIHPRIEELYLAGEFHDALDEARGRAAELHTPGRRREERLALALLEQIG